MPLQPQRECLDDVSRRLPIGSVSDLIDVAHSIGMESASMNAGFRCGVEINIETIPAFKQTQNDETIIPAIDSDSQVGSRITCPPPHEG